MKQKIIGCIIAVVSLSLGAAGYSSSCDPLDANRPLSHFTLRLEIPGSYVEYPYPAEDSQNKCTFTGSILENMTFNKLEKSGLYRDDHTGVLFKCRNNTTKQDDIPTYNFLVKTIGLRNKPGTFSISNCRYEGSSVASGATPKSNSLDQGATNRAPLNLKDNEKRLIAQAVQEANGNTAAAAKQLGISERALVRKMKEYHITENSH